MQKLMIANWKMHGDAAMLSQWARQFIAPPNCQVVVCPPYPYLAAARQLLPPSVAIGAQTLFSQAQAGAYTGEVSARMLADVGCQYVLVGHSERRARGENNDDCAAQIIAASEAGLIPVLCIGEDNAHYAARQTAAVLQEQLAVLAPLKIQRLAIAYEPIWAIGSGKTPSAEELSQAARHIRNQLISQKVAIGSKIPILYGGSIKTDNASLLRQADMDGGLVGGASLNAADFAKICLIDSE